ncbi:hypothetical protein D3C72_1080860 [compost metagenome]
MDARHAQELVGVARQDRAHMPADGRQPVKPGQLRHVGVGAHGHPGDPAAAGRIAAPGVGQRGGRPVLGAEHQILADEGLAFLAGLARDVKAVGVERQGVVERDDQARGQEPDRLDQRRAGRLEPGVGVAAFLGPHPPGMEQIAAQGQHQGRRHQGAGDVEQGVLRAGGLGGTAVALGIAEGPERERAQLGGQRLDLVVGVAGAEGLEAQRLEQAHLSEEVEPMGLPVAAHQSGEDLLGIQPVIVHEPHHSRKTGPWRTGLNPSSRGNKERADQAICPFAESRWGDRQWPTPTKRTTRTRPSRAPARAVWVAPAS